MGSKIATIMTLGLGVFGLWVIVNLAISTGLL